MRTLICECGFEAASPAGLKIHKRGKRHDVSMVAQTLPKTYAHVHRYYIATCFSAGIPIEVVRRKMVTVYGVPKWVIEVIDVGEALDEGVLYILIRSPAFASLCEKTDQNPPKTITAALTTLLKKPVRERRRNERDWNSDDFLNLVEPYIEKTIRGETVLLI